LQPRPWPRPGGCAGNDLRRVLQLRDQGREADRLADDQHVDDPLEVGRADDRRLSEPDDEELQECRLEVPRGLAWPAGRRRLIDATSRLAVSHTQPPEADRHRPDQALR
jgi:hypothetical protein